jgi:hypothetical protein
MLCSSRRQPARELGARADAELAIRAREVGLDRALAHEQLGSDLAVGPALRRQLGDALLGRREHIAIAGTTAAEPRDLLARTLCPRLGAQLGEDRARGLERRTYGAALLGAPLSASSVRARSNGWPMRSNSSIART